MYGCHHAPRSADGTAAVGKALCGPVLGNLHEERDGREGGFVLLESRGPGCAVAKCRVTWSDTLSRFSRPWDTWDECLSQCDGNAESCVN